MLKNILGVSRIAAGVVLTLAAAASTFAQAELKTLPDPYKPPIEHWGQLPEGRPWGAVSALQFDSKGNLWVFERCGANTCLNSDLNPILEFDLSGKLLTSFGGGMFVFPHGMFVDKDDNVWATDADAKNGKGNQVFKFSPKGEILMKLGKAGVGGESEDEFNKPSGVVVAKNGDIFVSDGHGGNSNARIVKFSKDGKFIKTWGQKGTEPGQFGELHGIVIDNQGRVLVADRGNNRIQVFDQGGKFIAEWKQFGIPSAFYVDKHDMLYVGENRMNPDGARGIIVGSLKDQKPTAVLADPDQDAKARGVGSESVAVDAKGNIFGGQVDGKQVMEYVKK